MNSVEQEIANAIQAMETGESRYIEGSRIVTQSEIDLADMEAQQALEAQQVNPELMSEGQAIVPQLTGEAQPIPGTGQGPQAFGGVEDQTNIDAIAGPVDGMGIGEFLETTGQVFSGAAGGAVTATLGLPGDVIGIIEGIVKASGAEEGEGLNAFLQGMGRVSEQYGSAATTKMLYDFVDSLDITEEAKEQIKAGSALLGEWGEIPGVAVAAQTFMSGVRKAGEYAAGAEARIAERGVGTTLRSGFDPTELTDQAIVAVTKLFSKDPAESAYVSIRQNEEVRLAAQTAVKEIANTKGNSRPKVDDVADYFDSQHQQIYGRKLNPEDDNDFLLAVTDTANEIRYQLDQGTSGKGWYDNDVRQTFENLSRIPGLERLADDESLRVLWTALAAPTSIGQKVDPGNTKAATAALLSYLRTGVVPVNPPAPGAVTEGIKGAGWGQKQQSVAAGMKVIKYLVETKGVDGFADWWLSPHSLKELTEIRKAAGLGSGPSGVGGGRDSLHLGSMILGDKTGKYSLNLNGYQATTKDSWFSRSYNRHFGSMRNPDGSLAEAPRNLQERARMEEFVSRVIDELGDGDLSEQDTQAVLWFFEQNLYTDLGVPSRPGSFGAASEKLENELRSGVRGSDEVEAGAEQASEGLTDFRGVGAKQRTVRSGRRPGPAGASDSQNIGAASGPYARASAEGDEGNGLLVLNPDPVSQRKYEAAGLSVPAIKEVPATEAVAYNQEMTAAMAGRSDAAQVEIKTPDELAEARLFRTESGSGFAIKPDGDIVAVFASKNEPSGGGYSMLQAAVQAGGRKLDAFDTYLPAIYETAGFRPVARVRWNDEYAPPNWNKADFADFNNGEPDVILFVYDPNYFGGKVDIPSFDDYDEAAKIQDAEVQNIKLQVDQALGGAQ